MSAETTRRERFAGTTTSGATQLDSLAMAGAGAVVSAAVMLLLSVFAAIGIYTGAARMMMEWHLFYDTTAVGTVSGMLEAAIVSFALLYAFGWTYNTLTR